MPKYLQPKDAVQKVGIVGHKLEVDKNTRYDPSSTDEVKSLPCFLRVTVQSTNGEVNEKTGQPRVKSTTLPKRANGGWYLTSDPLQAVEWANEDFAELDDEDSGEE